MPSSKTLIAGASIVVSFVGLAGAIVFLPEIDVISSAMAKLMLVALLAIYIGFGFLIAVYQLVNRLK